jgi:hypothetical protein
MPFVPGVELSGRYFRDLVEPILAREFPDLRYSAALIGYGSEILGFDTPMSTDHNWGPRVLLFLSPEDQARLDAVIIAHLDERIPETFLGWPTRIKIADANAPDADAEGRRPAALRVETHSLRSWVRGWLGVRADAELDWRGGSVFRSRRSWR